MDFTNIDIKDERSRVRRAFGKKLPFTTGGNLPQINGGNFIGVYPLDIRYGV